MKSEEFQLETGIRQFTWLTTYHRRDMLVEEVCSVGVEDAKILDVIQKLKCLALEEEKRRESLPNEFVKCPRCRCHHSEKNNPDCLCERCEHIVHMIEWDGEHGVKEKTVDAPVCLPAPPLPNPSPVNIPLLDIAPGTKFIINWGPENLYFDDNLECLAYCWLLKEESGGLCSLVKIGVSHLYYPIQRGELKRFSPTTLSPERLDLYAEWLEYFKSIRWHISYKWFLCLNSSAYNMDSDREFCLRERALALLDGRKTCDPSQFRPHSFFVELRKIWRITNET